jgi:hypothetical protein
VKLTQGCSPIPSLHPGRFPLLHRGSSRVCNGYLFQRSIITVICEASSRPGIDPSANRPFPDAARSLLVLIEKHKSCGISNAKRFGNSCADSNDLQNMRFRLSAGTSGAQKRKIITWRCGDQFQGPPHDKCILGLLALSLVLSRVLSSEEVLEGRKTSSLAYQMPLDSVHS